MRNREVADLLFKIADGLDLSGENFFKIRAYRKAGNVIKDLPEDIAKIYKDGKLEKIEAEGVVLEALPNATFKVQLNNSDRILLCHLAGKMRLYRIRVLPGDKVKVELTPYDDSKGRIVYRVK